MTKQGRSENSLLYICEQIKNHPPAFEDKNANYILTFSKKVNDTTKIGFYINSLLGTS